MQNDKIDGVRSIIFDLDGTILDTIGDIALAVNTVLMARGFAAAPVDEYRRRVGWGIMETVRLSLPPDTTTDAAVIQAIADECREYMNANPVKETVAYTGIAALLDQLERRDVALFVLTNKPDKIAQTVVHTLFPKIRFTGVLGQRDDFPPKPDPAGVFTLLGRGHGDGSACGGEKTDTCVLVGDSAVDIQTARNAGCTAVGVLWGYGDRDDIKSAAPDYLCYSVDDLQRILGLHTEGERP